LKTYNQIGENIAAFGGPDWSSTGGCGRSDNNFGPGFNRTASKGSPVIPETPQKLYSDGDFALYSMLVLKGHYEAGLVTEDEFTPGKYLILILQSTFLIV
jgi:hypothetical protein